MHWTPHEHEILRAAPWWTIAANQLPHRTPAAVRAQWRRLHPRTTRTTSRPPLTAREQLWWRFFIAGADWAAQHGRRLDVSAFIEALHGHPDWAALAVTWLTHPEAWADDAPRLPVLARRPHR